MDRGDRRGLQQPLDAVAVRLDLSPPDLVQPPAGQLREPALDGRGVVEMPSRSTFYRLVSVLADPADRPGLPARTATAPVRTSSAPVVLRPGEQVQIDTTRLDIMAVLEDGSLGRPELTIAADAALLLAEMAVPHPARPAWPSRFICRTRRCRISGCCRWTNAWRARPPAR